MSDDLKPCPFCGEKYVTTEFDRGQGDKWGYASCDVCAACGPEVRTNYDREPDGPWHSEAIAAWNTRADADRIEELEGERDEAMMTGHDLAKIEYRDLVSDLEAKLAKAVEALRDTTQMLSQCTFTIIRMKGQYFERLELVDKARAVLAELEGE